MSSKNPETRKRQKKRSKERSKRAKQREKRQWRDEASLKYSPYQEDRFMCRSCATKNRYDTEEKAIHACIVGSAKRGATLTWYKCGRCNGWHITSHRILVD